MMGLSSHYDRMAMEISKTTVVTVVSILVIAIGMYIGIRPRATDEAAAGEPAAAHRNVAEPSQEDSTTTIASTNNDPRPGDLDQEPDWKVYKSDEYGYEIKYPPDARIRGPGRDRVYIDIGGGADIFVVEVIENSEGLTAREWAEQTKAKRRADGLPDAVVLPDSTPAEGPVQVGTLSGYRLRIWDIDVHTDLVLVAAGRYMYVLGFPGFNHWHPNFPAHYAMYLRILQTFRLLPQP